jgi:hypothetical protein
MMLLNLFAIIVFCLAVSSHGFKPATSRRLSVITFSQNLLSMQSGEALPIVEAKILISGKNVQGPWYRTVLKHEVL